MNNFSQFRNDFIWHFKSSMLKRLFAFVCFKLSYYFLKKDIIKIKENKENLQFIPKIIKKKERAHESLESIIVEYLGDRYCFLEETVS